MTVSMNLGRYKLIFSDTHFEYARKKPTLSIYDKSENCETLYASFRSKDAFDSFIEMLRESHVLYEKERNKDD